MFQLDQTNPEKVKLENNISSSIFLPLIIIAEIEAVCKLTVDVDVDVGGDGLGVVVVVPPALQLGVEILPGEPLQLHRVPALPRRDLLPAGVEEGPRPPPGHTGAGPACQ